MSASEEFDPTHPQWPPFYEGTYLFPTVYMGRGTLLVPAAASGGVRSIGLLVHDEDGHLRPELHPHVRVRLTPEGAELVEALRGKREESDA